MDADKRKAFFDYIESNMDVEFDLFSQNLDEWAWLAEHIPGIVVSSAGGLMPFQASGLLLGYPFYYREEQGSCSLRVAEKGGDPCDSREVLYSSYYNFSNEFMSRGMEFFPEAMMKLVPKLERAAFLWEFPSQKIIWLDGKDKDSYVVSEEPDITIGWGQTPEEGYAASREPSEYLMTLDNPWSAEFQDKMWVDQKVSPIPSNADTRSFPENKPNFRVAKGITNA